MPGARTMTTAEHHPALIVAGTAGATCANPPVVGKEAAQLLPVTSSCHSSHRPHAFCPEIRTSSVRDVLLTQSTKALRRAGPVPTSCPVAVPATSLLDAALGRPPAEGLSDSLEDGPGTLQTPSMSSARATRSPLEPRLCHTPWSHCIWTRSRSKDTGPSGQWGWLPRSRGVYPQPAGHSRGHGHLEAWPGLRSRHAQAPRPCPGHTWHVAAGHSLPLE